MVCRWDFKATQWKWIDYQRTGESPPRHPSQSPSSSASFPAHQTQKGVQAWKLATFLSLILALSLSQSLPAPHPCFKTSPGASLFIVELTSTPLHGCLDLIWSSSTHACQASLSLSPSSGGAEPLHPPYLSTQTYSDSHTLPYTFVLKLDFPLPALFT